MCSRIIVGYQEKIFVLFFHYGEPPNGYSYIYAPSSSLMITFCRDGDVATALSELEDRNTVKSSQGSIISSSSIVTLTHRVEGPMRGLAKVNVPDTNSKSSDSEEKQKRR